MRIRSPAHPRTTAGNGRAGDPHRARAPLELRREEAEGRARGACWREGRFIASVLIIRQLLSDESGRGNFRVRSPPAPRAPSAAGAPRPPAYNVNDAGQ
ncbi:hypothetical protein EVAR_21491_1 [Eumeta japonica]|uniref:Uncharacterized protein n=1 Tax=Eumeta variegata TaxID=151549 RepID=A0A4C1UXI7_EUMVA|nr:hypothetical protein EVAR_21491_1 [Eumeta japonica]